MQNEKRDMRNVGKWFLVGLVLLVVACAARDPVVEMQKSLASAPDYMIILDDMHEQGVLFTNYYHKYQVVQGDRTAKTDWVEVPESVYRKYENFLGMALAAKSDSGVTNTPHPAGYHYVGNPRYGEWQRSGGQSFWVFYGQYAMMRSLLGGGGIFRSDYQDYRGYQRSNRPYYGSERQYGTQGSVTRQKKPTFYERRQRALERRQSSFSRRASSRIGRGRTGFGRGGFGK